LGDDTDVTVTYDVTSLSPNGSAFVKELEDSFDAFLGSWHQEIFVASTREGTKTRRRARPLGRQ
jgi:hypothetical protein